MFIVFLPFSEPLACNRTMCLFLNDESCMVRPPFIGMNPVPCAKILSIHA